MKKILSLSFFVFFLAILAFSASSSKPTLVSPALAACTPGFQTCGGSLPRGYQQCNSAGTAYTQHQCGVGYHCGGVPGDPGNVSCYADTPPPTATPTSPAGPTPTKAPTAVPTSPPSTGTCAGPNGVGFAVGEQYCVGDSYPGNGPTQSSGVVCAAPITSEYRTCGSNGSFTAVTCPSGNSCGYYNSKDVGCFAACSTTTGGPTPTAGGPTPTPIVGGNYTVSGKVFKDLAYSGSTSQAAMAGISVSIPPGVGISNGSTVTDANGNYKITLPYTTGQYVYTVSVSAPKGYTISPGTITSEGEGTTVSVGFSPTNAHPTVNFGLVTPPSSVKVDYGSYTINTSIIEYDLFGGKPQILLDQTVQCGGTGPLTTLTHALTDGAGKVSFTGIKPSEWGCALMLAHPPLTTTKTVIVNGVDIGGRNPIKFAYWTVDMTGWNQSLMIPLGNGVVFFNGFLYIDPAKNPAPLNVQWVLNPPSTPQNFNGYWLIPYPNGGGYCMPVSLAGQPIQTCASFKNNPPGGVTGTGPAPIPTSAASPTLSPSPTGTPIVCDVITSTGPCHGAIANTCNTNNGTQTVIYDNSSIGQLCQQKIVNTICTYNNCSAGNTCQNGSCGNPTQPTTTPTVTVVPTNNPTTTPTTVPPTTTSAPTTTPVPGFYNLTFSGTVYLDTNNNGVKDSGELGQAVFWTNSSNPAPVTISSANGAGSVGAGTNSTGLYTINVTNHPAGSDVYTVTMSTPPGFALTSTSPVSVPISSGGTHTVNFGLRSTIITPTFTPTPTLSPTPIPSPTVSPTPAVGDIVFQIVLGLDGIGSAGDNAAPNNSSGSNKNPLHKTRELTLELYNSSNSLVSQTVGHVLYDSLGGQFLGSINQGNNLVSGSYTIKLRSPGYLKKLVPGVQVLTTTSNVNNVPVQPLNLVTGDITQDNAINIIDYNIFISCSIYSSDAGQLCNTNSSYRLLSDLDDNGVVNEFDYNLFVREYSVQNGQ